MNWLMNSIKSPLASVKPAMSAQTRFFSGSGSSRNPGINV